MDDIEARVQKWKELEKQKADEKVEALEQRLARAREENEMTIEFRERRYRRLLRITTDKIEGIAPPERLPRWLRFDTWTVDEGLVLLCGFDPKGIRFNEDGTLISVHSLEPTTPTRLDGLDFSNPFVSEIVGSRLERSMKMAFAGDRAELKAFWSSGNHTETRYPPKYFIDWIESKGFKIPWKEWAVKNGYLGQSQEGRAQEKPLTTKERNTLLTIIAVLCKEAKFDHKKASKTAGLIRGTANGMGLDIGETTIENHLKKIDDALEGRMK